eukprot:scaffold164549_cov34-Prasinocladus_malaysianus.AAC.1
MADISYRTSPAHPVSAPTSQPAPGGAAAVIEILDSDDEEAQARPGPVKQASPSQPKPPQPPLRRADTVPAERTAAPQQATMGQDSSRHHGPSMHAGPSRAPGEAQALRRSSSVGSEASSSRRAGEAAVPGPSNTSRAASGPQQEKAEGERQRAARREANEAHRRATASVTGMRWLSRHLSDVLEAVKKADKMKIFREPVKISYAPDYYDVIKKPICIRDIE